MTDTHSMTPTRRLAALLDSEMFGRFITAVILVNAVTLGLETAPVVMEKAGALIHLIDYLCLSIFVVEILAKLYVRRLRFFTSGWNVFDFVIVGIALVPSGQGLSVLRALRILRVLRVISVAPRLRRVVEGFITALPGMGSVFLLMTIIFYIGAVIATKLFGNDFPEWFGGLGRSAYSLFQIMTLESWSMGIVRPVMDEFPMAWAFFVPFIVVTAFSVLNLFIGLLVNTMQSAVEADAEAEFEKLRDLVRSETDIVDAHVIELQQEIRELRKELTAARGGGTD